jgi:hypothetical protein
MGLFVDLTSDNIILGSKLSIFIRSMRGLRLWSVVVVCLCEK